MSLLQRAKALGFSSAFEMVKATGFSNSALSEMMRKNNEKFLVVTLSARIGELSIDRLRRMTGGAKKELTAKRLCELTTDELKELFGEAI